MDETLDDGDTKELEEQLIDGSQQLPDGLPPGRVDVRVDDELAELDDMVDIVAEMGMGVAKQDDESVDSIGEWIIEIAADDI